MPNLAKNKDKSGGTIPVKPSAVPNLAKNRGKAGGTNQKRRRAVPNPQCQRSQRRYFSMPALPALGTDGRNGRNVLHDFEPVDGA